jgi:hypothetical protein
MGSERENVKYKAGGNGIGWGRHEKNDNKSNRKSKDYKED